MRSSEIHLISSHPVQEYLSVNEGVDEMKIVLAKKEVFGVPAAEIAAQLIGRRKAKWKLPSWYKKGIVFPHSLHLEQSSSEATGKFKAELMQSHIKDSNLFVDLTGGFGVDTFFLGKLFSQTIHIEPDEALSSLVIHNHKLLGAENIVYLKQTAEEFVQTNKKQVNLFFLDPSRRSDSKKVVKLAECQPNVLAMQDALFASSHFILIKTSPLLDIQQALRELKHVVKVVVVSIENECKELLFLQQLDFVGEPTIETVNLNREGIHIDQFSFFLSKEKIALAPLSSALDYLYEPNASILKAGAFKLIAENFRLFKLHTNTHLYTSKSLDINFPGRVFKLEALNPDDKTKEKLLPEGKANVATRNYPLSALELKRKLKLKDGGEKFVLGFTEQNRKSIAIVSRVK